MNASNNSLSKSMDSPANSNPDSPVKRKRKNRYDQNNRNYLCGCGKSYLSYPALFTHVKQKHNGERPKNTIIPSKRNTDEENNNENHLNSDKKNNDNNQEDAHLENGIDEFVKFVEGFSKEKNGAINYDPNDCLKNFPNNMFKDENDFIAIRDQLGNIISKPDSIEDLRKYGNCNKIFAYFLYKISNLLKPSLYKEIAVFICALSKTINIVGKNEEDNNDLQYCERYSAEKILEFSNDFITSYLPNFMKELKNDELVIIGSNEERMKNAVLLTQYFGNWLFFHGFTNLKLELNYEENS